MIMNSKHDEILKICEQKLKYFNYSPRTVEMYCHYIEKFLIHTNKYPQHLVSSDFQNYLNLYPFSSISQQNQIINAIKFLYEKGLNKKYDKVDFERPRGERKLPQVIDKEFLLEKINEISNIKHKSILSIAYSVGLRVSEVINLKIEDIDSKRGLIHIIQGKGKKDRDVPLSSGILGLLREYYKQYRPTIYLFNGQDSLQYTASSCNKLVKNYLGKEYHFHLLRHSCFTSLLESGTDLRIIQTIAGHNSSKTTEIYTHVSTQLLSKVQLPL
jgi:site-specific recombinase XerD